MNENDGAILENLVDNGQAQEPVEDANMQADEQYEYVQEEGYQQPEEEQDVDKSGGKSSEEVEELKQRLQMTEQQLEYFRELLKQNQDLLAMVKDKNEVQEKDPFEELDPDEPLTVGQVKELQKRIMQEAQKNIQEVDSKYRRSLAIISEKAARLRYKDYDEVMPYAVEMAKQDPLILQRIATSDDPAEEAYQWGLRNPKYLEKIKNSTKKDVADKIKTNLAKSSTSVPNRSKNIAKKDPFEMTPEEFAEYKRRIMEG